MQYGVHAVTKNALQIVCVSCFTMLATVWAHVKQYMQFYCFQLPLNHFIMHS